MDIISKETQDAMKTLASVRFGYPEKDCILFVDYDKEEIIFTHNQDILARANCSMDSEIGSVKDFSRQIITRDN